MSRVDDDRQAQRIAERIALEKRQNEERAQKKQQGESAFSRLLQQSTQDKGQVAKQQLAQKNQAEQLHGDDDVTEAGSVVHEDASLQDAKEQGAAQDRARARKTGTAFTDKLKQARAGEGERASESRFADAGKDTQATAGRSSDQRGSELRSESRREDARTGRESLSEKGESALKGGQGARGAFGAKGDLKTDGEGGGKGGSGGQGKDQGSSSSNLGGGFRFNPALMAPVPVAKPLENKGSERLRALAQEIAQKIVERVRVGTNAAGTAEFQIDLRSNVLKGLSIKVSGGNGKIRAVFQGSDKEVLKLLEENADGLKQALGGRGLKLEELRIEERA